MYSHINFKSYSIVVQNASHLKCDAVLLNAWFMMIWGIDVPSPSASSSTNISFLFGLLNHEDESTVFLKMSETTHSTTQCHIQKAWVFYQQVSETIILQQAVNFKFCWTSTFSSWTLHRWSLLLIFQYVIYLHLTLLTVGARVEWTWSYYRRETDSDWPAEQSPCGKSDHTGRETTTDWGSAFISCRPRCIYRRCGRSTCQVKS